MLEDKLFYNEMSSERLGWSPEWLGHSLFDEELISRIEKFQREHNLTVDGLVGPNTYRRLYTEYLAFQDNNRKYIICNKRPVIINWHKVITLDDIDNAYEAPPKTYKSSNLTRSPRQFICHWDATLSSKRCFDILQKRGLSVHFMIDNDGTIIQSADTNHICWHAKPNNDISIGVEISNAVYPKYQSYYERNGFGKRPVHENVKINNWKLPHSLLGFYSVQLNALTALIDAITRYYDTIPLQTPEDYYNVSLPESKRRTYSGVISHYHINEKKIDCANLNLERIIENIKEIR
jgi:hypothetical protein